MHSGGEDKLQKDLRTLVRLVVRGCKACGKSVEGWPCALKRLDAAPRRALTARRDSERLKHRDHRSQVGQTVAMSASVLSCSMNFAELLLVFCLHGRGKVFRTGASTCARSFSDGVMGKDAQSQTPTFHRRDDTRRSYL